MDKKKIIIINGPNLNLLGKREPEIYGTSGFEGFFEELKECNPQIELEYYQSNLEGELVNKIQETDEKFDGIILNAAAYTHTSVAIHDAIGAISVPVLEVHISNIYKREEFRHKSIISSKCIGMISGLGLKGYQLGLDYFQNSKKKKMKIAIIAHDGKKPEMVSFLNKNKDKLQKIALVATGTTGKYVENTGLQVEKLLSGPIGGDAQIAALSAEKKLEMVLFFRDPLGKHPHEPDVQMLMRICDVHNIPIATNPATAQLLIDAFWRKQME